jgi:hypothetical protein
MSPIAQVNANRNPDTLGRSWYTRDKDVAAIKAAHESDVVYFNADHFRKFRIRFAEPGTYPPDLTSSGEMAIVRVGRGNGEKEGHLIHWYVARAEVDVEREWREHDRDYMKWFDDHCNPILKRWCFRSDSYHTNLWTYKKPDHSGRDDWGKFKCSEKVVPLKRDTATPKPRVEPSVEAETPAEIRPSQARLPDAKDIPPRAWLYDGHLIRKFASGTIAAGGVGKSALKLAECISMATGKGLLTGADFAPLRVWYWNGEDPLEETERRVAAIQKHCGISPADIGGRLFLDSGRSLEIVLARESRTGFALMRPVHDALVKALKANRIDAFIVDPFVSAHQVSENDNSKIDAVAKDFMKIADEANCAIELVHHSRKTGGAEVDVEDSRGGSALINALRSTRVLNKMSKEEAKKYFVDETQRRLYFKVDDGKPNLSPPNRPARWFKLESVYLGNDRPGIAQDNVGVVVSWDPPSIDDGLPGDALELAQAALAGGRWKAFYAADDWVGLPIARALGLNPDDDNDKRRVRKLLKSWTAAGFFREVEERDEEQRKTRKYVRVGDKF